MGAPVSSHGSRGALRLSDAERGDYPPRCASSPTRSALIEDHIAARTTVAERPPLRMKCGSIALCGKNGILPSWRA